MLSRMITDRVRREKVLRKGLCEHREETVAAFVEQMAPYVEEGEDLEAGVSCLLRVLERRLAGHRCELEEVEFRHDETTGRLGRLRRERDEAARDLHREYAQLRTATAGLLGRDASNLLLGIEGPTASPRRTPETAQEAGSDKEEDPGDRNHDTAGVLQRGRQDP